MVNNPFKMLSAGKDVLRHQYFAAPSYVRFEASIGQTRRKHWDLSAEGHPLVSMEG